MRWILIAMTVVGILAIFLTRSPLILGLGLLSAFIGAFGLVFSIAGERISANARPDTTMLQPDVLAAIRERAQEKAARESKAPSETNDRQI